MNSTPTPADEPGSEDSSGCSAEGTPSSDPRVPPPTAPTGRSLAEIARHLGGERRGDPDLVLTGVAGLETAGEGQISYVESPKYLKDLERSSASAVVAGPSTEIPDRFAAVVVRQPTVAWARVVELFHPRQRRFSDVSREARIGRECRIAEGVGIAPGAYIGDRVRIGRASEIGPGTTIGDGTVVGADCLFHAGVHVYDSCRIGDRVILHSGVVIGADGYGFAQEETGDEREPVRHVKVPQVGTVIIEDDVEIGANTTVDRAALDATVIGKGTKIDNLVMVAHNCRVGPHCLLVAQVGMSGSIQLGPYVTIAGQAGLVGHVKVGARAIIGAKAGVMKDVPDGEILLGSPALPAGLARRAYAQIENLPEFRKTLHDLQKEVAELRERLGPPERGAEEDG